MMRNTEARIPFSFNQAGQFAFRSVYSSYGRLQIQVQFLLMRPLLLEQMPY